MSVQIVPPGEVFFTLGTMVCGLRKEHLSEGLGISWSKASIDANESTHVADNRCEFFDASPY